MENGPTKIFQWFQISARFQAQISWGWFVSILGFAFCCQILFSDYRDVGTSLRIDWLIDWLSTTNPPTSSSSSSLYGKKTCKKEQEEEEEKEAIWKQRRRRIKTSSKLKNQGFGFSLWICRLHKMCLYVVDGNSDPRGCDQFVLIKILPTCPTRFEELLLLFLLLLWFGDRASA